MARPLTRREKWLLIAASIFVVIFLSTNYVLMPRWAEYQDIQEEIKTKKDSYNSMQVVKLNINKMALENKKKASEIDYPKNTHLINQGTVLMRLDGLAAERGLEMLFYQPSAGDVEPLQSQTAEVKIAGPYRKIVDLFEVLDNEPYRTKVQVYYIKSIYSEMQNQDNQAMLETDAADADILNDYVVVHFSIKIYDMPEETPYPDNANNSGISGEDNLAAVAARMKNKKKAEPDYPPEPEITPPKPIIIETVYGAPLPPIYIIVYRDKPSTVAPKK